MNTESRFIACEYLALWKDFGIEGLPSTWDGLLLAPEPSAAAQPSRFPLMFVGESREALVEGATGKLLAKITEAMGQQIDAVALSGCGPSLAEEIASAGPRIIVALGEAATRTLLGESASLADHRGNFLALRWDASIQVLPTYDPAYLIRTPEAKKRVWEDMKKVMNLLAEI